MTLEPTNSPDQVAIRWRIEAELPGWRIVVGCGTVAMSGDAVWWPVRARDPETHLEIVGEVRVQDDLRRRTGDLDALLNPAAETFADMARDLVAKADPETLQRAHCLTADR